MSLDRIAYSYVLYSLWTERDEDRIKWWMHLSMERVRKVLAEAA